MNCAVEDSPLYNATFPYSSSIASSASSSSASVWSSGSSQSSDDSSVNGPLDPDSDSCCDRSLPAPPTSALDETSCPAITTLWPKHLLPTEGAAPRSHPRRTSVSSTRAGPPSLVRQCDRKVSFVDSLVGKPR
jgi:hypothetical protein